MKQASDSSRVLFVGNATIDVKLGDEEHTLEDDLIKIKDPKTGYEIEIQLNPGASDKRIAKSDLWQKLQGFTFTEKFGGGALNSARVYKKIALAEILYLDPARPAIDSTVPGTSLRDFLRSEGITSEFLSATPMPVNIVLGNREGKLIIKSPINRYELSGVDSQLLNWLQKEYNLSHVVINSLKDQQIAEAVADQPHVYGVFTTSLDPDFVLERLVSRCEAMQFNYDEFGYIINSDHKVVGDENERFESAFEGISKLRQDYKASGVIFVTLGSNGVLVSVKDKIYHAKLNEGAAKRVQSHVQQDPACVTGAGDCAGAYFLKGLINGLEPLQIGIEGSLGSINHLGYHSISPSDFIAAECTKGKPQYQPIFRMLSAPQALLSVPLDSR